MAEQTARGYEFLHGASLQDVRGYCEPEAYGQFLRALGGKLDRYFGPEGPLGPWSAGVPSGASPARPAEPAVAGGIREQLNQLTGTRRA